VTVPAARSAPGSWRAWRPACALAWFACASLLAAPGRAQPAPTEPIEIAYQGPTDCPPEAFFRAQLLARTPRVRAARSGEPARRVAVTVDTSAGRTLGRLVIRELDGQESAREVGGDACAEVVSALALIAAISVDPNAVTTPLVAAAVPPPPAAPPPEVTPPLPPPPPRALFPVRFGVGGTLSVASSIAPATMVGGRLSLELAFRAARFPPSIRLGLERSNGSPTAVAGGVLDFTRTIGVLEVAPLEVAWGRLAIAPLVGLEAGALRAVASEITPARSATRAFVALGTGARVDLVLVGPLALEAAVGVAFPVTRDRFFFEPDTTVSQAAPAGFRGSFGLMARFP
jgi:hypothetical protein